MNQRSTEIDLTKGILTIGMVFAHIIQFFSINQNILLKSISEFTNLVSFSGFYFSFGYAVWIAYLQKETIPWKGVIKTVLKCYFAFLISGVTFLILACNSPLNLKVIFSVALLRSIPGYSEFLISFAIVTVVSSLCAPFVSWCTKSIKNILLACLLFIPFTFLPKEMTYDPYIGLFIGGRGFAYFPVIQYMPIFLLGVYFARHKVKYHTTLLLTCILLTLLYILLRVNNISISRFSPSVTWLFCSAGLVYIYYCTSILINRYCGKTIKKYLNAVGQNVLFYLLLSNMIIFSCVALGFGGRLSSFEIGVAFLAIMLGLFCLQYISVDLNGTNNRMHWNVNSAASTEF